MSQAFAEVIERVKQLSSAEKEELHELLKSDLIEERRREIIENSQTGMEEWKSGKLTPFADIDKLRDFLSNS